MTTTIPITILSIEDDGCHLLIKATIHNKSSKLLIDTGASKTVFDKDRIQRFIDKKEFREMDKLSTGLGTSSMETYGVTLKQIKLGNLEIDHFETILLDLSHVNNSYEGINFPPIDGVLGSDLMLRYNAIIDYKEKRMKLTWKSAKGRPPKDGLAWARIRRGEKKTSIR